MSQKKYILFGSSERIVEILKSLKGIEKYIKLLVGDKNRLIDGVQTLSGDELQPAQISDSDIFVLTNHANFVTEKIRTHQQYKVKMSQIITFHDWLIDMLDNNDIVFQPNFLRLEASTLCNLDCAGCYMRKEDSGTMGKGYLKLTDFQQLLEQNPFLKSIELANSGEVFMNPELIKIIEYAANKGVTLSIVSGCNFNDVKEDVIDALVKFGNIQAITVSIDGATQDVYSAYRRKGNLQKVLSNIKKLNFYKRKYGQDKPKLAWQYILFEHNEHEAEVARTIAECLDMKIYYKRDWTPGFKPKDPEKLAKITGLNFHTGGAYNPSTPSEYFSGWCSQMITEPQINFDGRILGCCAVYKSDWGLNIFKDGLTPALNSGRYRSGLKMILGGGVDGNDNPCVSCHQYKALLSGKKIIL